MLKPKTGRSLWPIQLYRVYGESMLPTYTPGDVLVGWRWIRRPRPGHIIVAFVGGRPLIKRLADILPDGRLVILGDNPDHSTDSRQFGPVLPDTLEARIILKL